MWVSVVRCLQGDVVRLDEILNKYTEGRGKGFPPIRTGNFGDVSDSVQVVQMGEQAEDVRNVPP